MALSSASFERNQVVLFLNRDFPYASTRFSQDTIKYGDYIPASMVEKWFKRYFPSNKNQYLYRLLETSVIQYLVI